MGCRTVRGILAAAPRESEFFSLRAVPFGKSLLPLNVTIFITHVRNCETGTTPMSSLGQWELSGRVLDLRLKGSRFKPHWRHWVVSLSKNINPSLVLVQPRKTRPFITERLLMGRKESNQTKSLCQRPKS